MARKIRWGNNHDDTSSDGGSPRSSFDASLTKRQPEQIWKPSTHEYLVILTLTLLSLVIALDATIIVTALNSVVQDIGATSTQAFWIGTSYLISCAVSMPFVASLSDVFGRPIVMLTSIGIFTLGTILCCVAQDIQLLLGGRGVQGVGGGGMYVMCLVIFTDIVPLRYRPKYYGIIQIAWALGTLAGPIMGGGIVEKTTWRWIFYMNFPVCAIGFIAVLCLLTLKPPTASFGEKLARVDFIGGFFFIVSLVTTLVALSWGGSQFAWGSAGTLVPLILGIAVLVLTILYENMFAPEPFLKRSLFKDWGATLVYVLGITQGFLMYGQIYYVPFYFQAVKDFSPIMAGVALLPVAVTTIPGSIVSGILVSRFNAYRWALWLGWGVVALGSGLIINWDRNTSTAEWIMSTAVTGLGHGLILNAQTFVSGAMVPPEEAGRAAAMYLFMRSVGTALGVNIGSTTFQNVMRLSLGWKGLPEDIARHAEEYLVVLRDMPDGAEKFRILDTYVYGFQGVHAVFTALAGTAFLASFLVKKYDLNQSHQTEHTLEENRFSRRPASYIPASPYREVANNTRDHDEHAVDYFRHTRTELPRHEQISALDSLIPWEVRADALRTPV